MSLGRDFSGSGQYIAWNTSATTPMDRYGMMMAWFYADADGASAVMAKVNAYRLLAANSGGFIAGSMHINGSLREAVGPDLVVGRWYHSTLWFDHSVNKVSIRLYDDNLKTATTYQSSSITPTVWDLESDTNKLYISNIDPVFAISVMNGKIACAKAWKFPDAATMMSAAQIDLERWTWFPQNRPDLCTFCAPIEGKAVELNYGSMTDKTGTTTGSPTAITTGPAGVHQIHPAQYRYRPTRLRM